jgi:hypothetical protein
VREIAVVALLARHWPEEGWHNCTLALCGGLLRGGIPQDRVERLVEALWRTAGSQDKPSDRNGCVKSTAEKIQAGEEVTGWPRFIELLGDGAKKVVDRVKKWLDLEPKDQGKGSRQTAQEHRHAPHRAGGGRRCLSVPHC